MRTGQYFRLSRGTPAIDKSGIKPKAITVPPGAILRATGVRNPENPLMIEVQWRDFRVFMFAVDVEERGEKILGTSELPG